MKVLLVEDDKFFSGQVLNMLQGAGESQFETTAFATVREAMDYLKYTMPDIIILDLNLPDSVGINTFIKIHQMAADTPIIILSAEEDENQALRAVKIGAQDYLMKRDVRNVLLIRAINYAVQRRIERKQAESALRKYAEELKARNSALTDANQRLEQEIARRGVVEQALRESQDEISKIFVNSPDIIYRLDSFGKIFYINKSPNDIPLEDLPGKVPTVFLASEFSELFNKTLFEVIASGNKASFEHTFKNDSKLYYTRLIPLFRNNVVESVLVISSDITERKQAETVLKELNIAKDRLFTGANRDLKKTLSILNDLNDILNPNFDMLPEIDKKKQIDNIKVKIDDIHKVLEGLLNWTQKQYGA